MEETKTIHINALPIEISVKVTNEVTAKGDLKPAAEVKVTRQLADTTQVEAIIKDILKLGVEETTRAIKTALGEDE
jgi:hypothetical protein